MNKLLSKTFIWMFVGLMITFLTGYIVSINENMVEMVLGSSLYWILVVLELALVIFFSARVHKMKPTTAKICFMLYAFVSGLTFSSIFIVFKISSIMYVFLATALVFAIFGAIGYYTKMDLTKFGTYLFMALIAVIICLIINIFLNNTTFDLVISIIAILIFIGFTAYDVNQMKKMAEYNVDNDVVAINGALQLYLDFINIFLHLISIVGDNK